MLTHHCNQLTRQLFKGIRAPGKIIGYCASYLVGAYYRFKYQFVLNKASFGRNIRIRGKLIIKGPGKVVFGDDILIDGRGHPVTPFTHSDDAKIIIGSQSFLNGTRFGCQCEIVVGPCAILADARIMDTDFHSTMIDRWSESAPVSVAPVKIGTNVWVAGQAAILKGVTIGDNSVIAFGAVVTNPIPADAVAAGNPAKVVKRLS